MSNARVICAVAISAHFLGGCAGTAVEEESRARSEHAEPVKPAITGSAGRLYVDDGGNGGLPVVFVHAFAGSSAHWVDQLAHLRPSRRAVALDLRGHGQSAAPASGDYAVESLASDIGAVADGLGLERFVLVGNSMGGSAAIAYAGAHADRVTGLVLVGAPGKAPPEQARQVLAALEADYAKVSEDYLKRLLAGAQARVETRIRSEMQRMPRETALPIIAAIFAYDPLPALAAYSGPKLLVDKEQGDELHQQVPDVPREAMSETSHWPQMDKPEEFNRILDAFLARVS